MSHVNLALAGLGNLASSAVATLDVYELNRLGVGMVAERQVRARAAANGWLAQVPLGRDRLDGPLEQVLEGLLRWRPAYTVAGEDRPFRDLHDLDVVDRALGTIEALGRFIVAMGPLHELEILPAGRLETTDLEWSAVVTTALARAALGQPARPLPLSPREAGAAVPVLLHHGAAGLRDLASGLGLESAGAFLADRLAEEHAELPAGSAVDPRFVRALLLRTL
jgi:hypothetical protein